MEESEKTQTSAELLVQLNKGLDEEAELYKKNGIIVSRLFEKLYEELRVRIGSHKGERFAFTVSGKTKVTLAYGPRENKTAENHFNLTFVGRIAKDASCLEQELTTFHSYDNGFLLPAEFAYVSNEPLSMKFAKTDAPYLNFYQREKPSWSIHTLLAGMIPKATLERLKGPSGTPFKSETCMKLVIGDKEFEEWQINTEGAPYVGLSIEMLEGMKP